MFWDITIEPILEQLTRVNGVQDVVAYANYEAIIIQGQNRQNLELHAYQTIEILTITMTM